MLLKIVLDNIHKHFMLIHIYDEAGHRQVDIISNNCIMCDVLVGDSSHKLDSVPITFLAFLFYFLRGARYREILTREAYNAKLSPATSEIHVRRGAESFGKGSEC